MTLFWVTLWSLIRQTPPEAKLVSLSHRISVDRVNMQNSILEFSDPSYKWFFGICYISCKLAQQKQWLTLTLFQISSWGRCLAGAGVVDSIGLATFESKIIGCYNETKYSKQNKPIQRWQSTICLQSVIIFWLVLLQSLAMCHSFDIWYF